MYRPAPLMSLRPIRGLPRMIPQPRIRNPQFIPNVPFDITQCESHFPPAYKLDPNSVEDKQLADMLLKRCQDVTPSAQEQQLITALVTQLSTIMEELIMNPAAFDAAQVEELRPVGSYKKGTMLTGQNIADVVVIFKTLPTKEAVRAFKDYLVEKMRSTELAHARFLTADLRAYGFEVVAPGCALRVMVATMHFNLKKLDPVLHLEVKVIEGALAAVRHIRWFEDNAGHTSIKLLIRLLKDLKHRYEGLEALSPWAIDMLAHYAILNNPTNNALPIHQAFKRVLQLLSAGLFLPGSAGILDPCEPGRVRLHANMSLEQQDRLCCTGQTLLRVVSHGGCRDVLGYGDDLRLDFVNDMSRWGEVIVVPSQTVYEKQDHVLTDGEESAYEDEAGVVPKREKSI